MAISGAGITAGTLIESITDASNLIMTKPATDSTATARSFSPSSSTNELERAELSEIEWLRSNGSGLGGYAAPKIYAVSRQETATPAGVNKVVLDVYPGVAALYFPVHYIPQFTPIDSATVTTPDVNDLLSRDIALMAAARMAPLVGRAELVPSIVTDVSERTRHALERKEKALQSGDQDR